MQSIFFFNRFYFQKSSQYYPQMCNIFQGLFIKKYWPLLKIIAKNYMKLENGLHMKKIWKKKGNEKQSKRTDSLTLGIIINP